MTAAADASGLLLDVVAPSGGDAAAALAGAATLARALHELPEGASLHFRTPAGTEVAIPATAGRMLLTILDEMAHGHMVALTSQEREVSTTEAAALLGVSRPHIVKLVETGLLPHRMAGTHRRILLEDVLAYKKRGDAAHATLDELARETEALGLYGAHRRKHRNARRRRPTR